MTRKSRKSNKRKHTGRKPTAHKTSAPKTTQNGSKTTQNNKSTNNTSAPKTAQNKPKSTATAKPKHNIPRERKLNTPNKKFRRAKLKIMLNILLGKNANKSIDNKKTSHVGEVYCGVTKYIDEEPKRTRKYVVVTDKNDNVTVAKLKTIKVFDEKGKNADHHLQEINSSRYNLENRTGVDHETFSKNRIKNKQLSIKDKDVFPNNDAEFKLGSHDLHNVLKHTRKNKK